MEVNCDGLPQPLWLLVSRSLRSSNGRLHEPALAVCQCLAPVFQPLLITELQLDNITPKHRVRLLQAIGRTGPIAPVVEVANMFRAMMRDKHPAVRDAAAELYYRMPDRQKMITAKPRTSGASSSENPGDNRKDGTPGSAGL